MNPARILSANLYLSDLLKGLASLPEAQDVSIRGLALDSRAVKQGDVFPACKGIFRPK
jgi:UDP-N-acetylmuramyl tripeptide synthase